MWDRLGICFGRLEVTRHMICLGMLGCKVFNWREQRAWLGTGKLEERRGFAREREKVELDNCLGQLDPGAGRLQGQGRGWEGNAAMQKPPGTLPRTMPQAVLLSTSLESGPLLGSSQGLDSVFVSFLLL